MPLADLAQTLRLEPIETLAVALTAAVEATLQERIDSDREWLDVVATVRATA